MSRSEPSAILFVLTGSIACYKACQAISRLCANGHRVQTVATQAALRFVGAATLEGLSGRPVASDLYAPGAMMDHIHLLRRADAVVVAPATANYLNKIAAGIADDLASTLFLAHRFDKPFLLAPAMNAAMFAHPATQAAINRLRDMGATVLPGDAGRLACGEEGEGRLLEPDALLEAIESRLPRTAASNQPAATRHGRIIVTAGGTQEPVDAVRVLGNVSTGNTGAALARRLAAHGYPVTLLLASNSAADVDGVEQVIRFGDYAELAQAMRGALADPQCRALVHAAAVSDYSVADADSTRKHSSDAGEWLLRLRRNPKLIDGVREQAANPDLLLIAFKLTAHADASAAEQAVQRLFARSRADYVVHNDAAQIRAGAHRFRVHAANGERRDCDDVDALARHLLDVLAREAR